MACYFITGIDTDIGKTYATALMAYYLKNKGESVITQKPVQTGSDGFSEDLSFHREFTGDGILDEDEKGLTCTYNFKFPASGHLASRMEGVNIEINKIIDQSLNLDKNHDFVLIEGAGGLMVPLNERESFLDLVIKSKFPLIIVSSARLGSINHTLLTLEVAHKYHLNVLGIVYNLYPGGSPEISEDSIKVFKDSLEKYSYPGVVIPIPQLKKGEKKIIDFSLIFKK